MEPDLGCFGVQWLEPCDSLNVERDERRGRAKQASDSGLRIGQIMMLLTERLGVRVKNSVRSTNSGWWLQGKAVGEGWSGADINFHVENG